VQFDADERTGGGVDDAMCGRDAPDPVAEVAAGIADAFGPGSVSTQAAGTGEPMASGASA
jgi:hypothetical protein